MSNIYTNAITPSMITLDLSQTDQQIVGSMPEQITVRCDDLRFYGWSITPTSQTNRDKLTVLDCTLQRDSIYVYNSQHKHELLEMLPKCGIRCAENDWFFTESYKVGRYHRAFNSGKRFLIDTWLYIWLVCAYR